MRPRSCGSLGTRFLRKRARNRSIATIFASGSEHTACRRKAVERRGRQKRVDSKLSRNYSARTGCLGFADFPISNERGFVIATTRIREGVQNLNDPQIADFREAYRQMQAITDNRGYGF